MKNEQVLQFLQEYLAWVNSGAGYHEAFDRDIGLCTNNYKWCKLKLGRSIEPLFQRISRFKDPHYPFNGDSYYYELECYNKMCHMNPKRLAWVRKTIKSLEKQNVKRNA